MEITDWIQAWWPIALFLLGAAWWASALYARVSQLCKSVDSLTAQVGSHQAEVWAKFGSHDDRLHDLDKRVSRLEPST